MTWHTLIIIAPSLIAFVFGTGSGVMAAQLMNKIGGGKINLLAGIDMNTECFSNYIVGVDTVNGLDRGRNYCDKYFLYV